MLFSLLRCQPYLLDTKQYTAKCLAMLVPSNANDKQCCCQAILELTMLCTMPCTYLGKQCVIARNFTGS